MRWLAGGIVAVAALVGAFDRSGRPIARALRSRATAPPRPAAVPPAVATRPAPRRRRLPPRRGRPRAAAGTLLVARARDKTPAWAERPPPDEPQKAGSGASPLPPRHRTTGTCRPQRFGCAAPDRTSPRRRAVTAISRSRAERATRARRLRRRRRNAGTAPRHRRRAPMPAGGRAAAMRDPAARERARAQLEQLDRRARARARTARSAATRARARSRARFAGAAARASLDRGDALRVQAQRDGHPPALARRFAPRVRRDLLGGQHRRRLALDAAAFPSPSRDADALACSARASRRPRFKSSGSRPASASSRRAARTTRARSSCSSLASVHSLLRGPRATPARGGFLLRPPASGARARARQALAAPARGRDRRARRTGRARARDRAALAGARRTRRGCWPHAKNDRLRGRAARDRTDAPRGDVRGAAQGRSSRTSPRPRSARARRRGAPTGRASATRASRRPCFRRRSGSVATGVALRPAQAPTKQRGVRACGGPSEVVFDGVAAPMNKRGDALRRVNGCGYSRACLRPRAHAVRRSRHAAVGAVDGAPALSLRAARSR